MNVVKTSKKHNLAKFPAKAIDSYDLHSKYMGHNHPMLFYKILSAHLLSQLLKTYLIMRLNMYDHDVMYVSKMYL